MNQFGFCAPNSKTTKLQLAHMCMVVENAAKIHMNLSRSFFPNLGILFIKINSSLIPIAQLSSYWIDSIPNIEKQVWQRLIRALYTRSYSTIVSITTMILQIHICYPNSKRLINNYIKHKHRGYSVDI